nr:hypothetical protein [Tanacetum cinerariifolium]
MGALPRYSVKNPKLKVISTSLALHARYYPIKDLECLSHTHNSINDINMCSKQTNENNQSKVKTLTVNQIGTSRSKEPEQNLEDKFKDLHLNLPVLEVLAHASMYNVIHDKYVDSLELGKNDSAFIQGQIPKKVKDPGLFTLPYILGYSKPFDTLADLGPCNIKCHRDHYKSRMKKQFYSLEQLASGRLVDGSPCGRIEMVIKDLDVKPKIDAMMKDFLYLELGKNDSAFIQGQIPKKKILPGLPFSEEWEIAKDAKLNPFKNFLVFKKMVEFLGSIPINLKGNMWGLEELIEKKTYLNMPLKEGNEVWYAKIRLIDQDGEEFTKTFQLIPTIRKLSEEKYPSEIIDLDYFHYS